jgi:hypothetical protein
MEFAGLPSGFERAEGAKPVLALHHSVTAFSVKKRLMNSLTFGGERARRHLLSSDAGGTQLCQKRSRTPVPDCLGADREGIVIFRLQFVSFEASHAVEFPDFQFRRFEASTCAPDTGWQ